MDVQSLSAIKNAKAALVAKVEALGLSVGTKVDNLGTSLGGKMDNVIASVRALPATLDSKFAVTNGKVDAVSNKLATHDADVKALLGDVGAVLDKINGEVV